MAEIMSDTFIWPQSRPWTDFTILFEQSILGILPTGLLVAAAPLYIYVASRESVKSRSGNLLWVKLAAAVCLAASELASLVFYSKSRTMKTDIALSASSLSCVSSILIIALVVIEHRHVLRPTSLFSLYVALSAVIDGIKCRSYFLRHGFYTDAAILGSLAAAACLSKVVLIIVQEFPKTHLLVDEDLKKCIGKEETSGFWWRSIFGWLNSTFAAGFKRRLLLDDLEPLNHELSSEVLLKKYRSKWKPSQKSRHRLLFVCLRTLWRPLLIAFFPRLVFTAFSLSQTFLLSRILKYVDNKDHSANDNGIERIGLILATGTLFAGRTMAKAAYLHAYFRMSTQTRGVLVSAMSEKQLRLSTYAARKSAIASLMTADVESIEDGVRNIHELVSYLIEIALGMLLLSRYIGLASLSIFVPCAFSTIYGFLVGKIGGTALRQWNESVELRISKTSFILGQVLPIRMIGLGDVVSGYLQRLRVAELDTSKRYRVVQAAKMFGVVVVDASTPVVVVGSAMLLAQFVGGFVAQQIFPILSLVVIVQGPLFGITSVMASIHPTISCFSRVQEYLELPEVQDNREIHSTLCPSEPSSKSVDIADNWIIKFDKVRIQASDESPILLEDVNITLPRGHFIPVLGPMSCGKSTFLRSIIGEQRARDGRITIRGRKNIAYCSQRPWLVNTSIRYNICDSDDLDEILYWQVVRACQLLQDFEEMDKGDMTVVGSDGVNLSVGQQMRVSLARTVYMICTGAEVLVIDDIFGSLDKVTAHAILEELFGDNGLLRERRPTTVIATQLEKSIDLADSVLVFDGERNMCHKLRTDFNVTDLKDGLRTTAFADQPMEPSESGGKSRLAGQSQITDSEMSVGQHSRASKSERGLYAFYLRSVTKRFVALWLAYMVGLAVFDSFPNGYVRIWVATAPENKLFFIGYALFAVCAAAVGLAGQRLFYLRLVPESGANLHRMLLDITLNATYDCMCVINGGSLLNRFSQDMNSIVQVLPLALYRFVFMGLSTLIEMAFVFAGASYASITLPFIAVIIYFIQLYYLRTSRQLRLLELDAKGPLFAHFTETANGLEHIRSTGQSSKRLERSLALLDRSQRAFYQLCCVQRWLLVVLDFTVAAVAVVIVSIALYVRDSTSSASIGLAFLILIEFGDTMSRTVMFWTEMEISLGSVSRLRGFFVDTPQEDTSVSAELPENWPQTGALWFQKVNSGYNSKTVLKDVSFALQGGEKVMLQGRTGSGKSSLLVTLLGFLKYSGTIVIDGKDIKTVPLQTLRRRITTIPQLPVVLPGSVRHNLTPFVKKQTEVTTRQIEEALDKVGIWATVLAKGGLDAQMETAGFSIAEQQLIAIARALLHHDFMGTKLVIIDEATASLSVASAQRVQQVLRLAFADCTVLHIGHWDSAMPEADAYLRVDGGSVDLRRPSHNQR